MSDARERAIGAGWDALEFPNERGFSVSDVAAVVDAASPIIRADEGDRYGRGWMLEALRTDVKAEVEAEVRERIATAIERNHAQAVADGSEGDGCTCEVAAWIARRT